MHDFIGKFFLIAAAAAFPAHAAGTKQLAVTATVVASCKLGVNVPKVGSEERIRGGVGSFSVACTRGATAATTLAQAKIVPEHESPGAGNPFLLGTQRASYVLETQSSTTPSERLESGQQSQIGLANGITVHERADEAMRLADYSKAVIALVMF